VHQCQTHQASYVQFATCRRSWSGLLNEGTVAVEIQMFREGHLLLASLSICIGYIQRSVPGPHRLVLLAINTPLFPSSYLSLLRTSTAFSLIDDWTQHGSVRARWATHGLERFIDLRNRLFAAVKTSQRAKHSLENDDNRDTHNQRNLVFGSRVAARENGLLGRQL